jgi:hypothetical protein
VDSVEVHVHVVQHISLFKTFQACFLQLRRFKLIQAVQNISSFFNAVQHRSTLFNAVHDLVQHLVQHGRVA